MSDSIRALTALLVVACSGSPAANTSVQISPEGSSGAQATASNPCGETTEALLASANLEGELQGEGMVYSAQLDGQGERETVLRARMMLRGEPENPAYPPLIDHLVVFECQQGTLTRTADWTFDATPDNGTIDCETGVQRVDMRQVAEREMFVLGTHQCQGSVDPRWDEERMLVLAYTGHSFEPVFSCAFFEEHATGPCRSGASFERRIRFSDEGTPTIHVEMDRGFSPGACDEEPAGGETGLSQAATYSWNGSAFITTEEDVCR